MLSFNAFTTFTFTVASFGLLFSLKFTPPYFAAATVSQPVLIGAFTFTTSIFSFLHLVLLRLRYPSVLSSFRPRRFAAGFCFIRKRFRLFFRYLGIVGFRHACTLIPPRRGTLSCAARCTFSALGLRCTNLCVSSLGLSTHTMPRAFLGSLTIYDFRPLGEHLFH